MLQHVAVRLEHIPTTDHGAKTRERRLQHVVPPVPGALLLGDAGTGRHLQPRNVLAKVVEQQSRLSFEGREAGQSFQLMGVECAV